MSTGERREREKAAQRQGILDAAQEIAREEGWQAVTVRKLAARIEYSPPMIYEHFAGKEAVLLELLRVGFGRLRDALATAQEGTHDARGRVTAAAVAYARFARAEPALYQVMYGLGGVPFGTAATPEEARGAFATLRAAVSAVLPEGGDADGETQAFWAALHGAASLAMAGRLRGGEGRGEELAPRIAAVFTAAWEDKAKE
jgi:AcrR family transcriptional regulator